MKILRDLFIGSLIGLCFFWYWYQIPSRDFLYFYSILWDANALIELKSYDVNLLTFGLSTLGLSFSCWFLVFGFWRPCHINKSGLYLSALTPVIVIIPSIIFILPNWLSKGELIIILILLIPVIIFIYVYLSSEACDRTHYLSTIYIESHDIIYPMSIYDMFYSYRHNVSLLPTLTPICFIIPFTLIFLPPDRLSALESEIIFLQSTATQQVINLTDEENVVNQRVTTTIQAQISLNETAIHNYILASTRDALAAQLSPRAIPNNSVQTTDTPAPTNTTRPSNTPSPTERIIATPSPNIEGTTVELQATQAVIERQSPEENEELIRDSSFQFTVGTIIGLLGVLLAGVQVWQGFRK